MDLASGMIVMLVVWLAGSAAAGAAAAVVERRTRLQDRHPGAPLTARHQRGGGATGRLPQR